MHILELQNKKEQAGEMEGKFILHSPKGPKNFTWLDPYMGLVRMEGVDDGFIRVNDLIKMGLTNVEEVE